MISIIPYVFGFSALDLFFRKMKVQGIYYITHVIHNAMVIYEVTQQPYDIMPSRAISMVLGFHLYHIILYFYKLRMIDWVHHILMCGILVLIFNETPDGQPIRCALFFTTGLPGMYDYMILGLERNHWIKNSWYRALSKYINVWIRGPGCVVSAYEIAQFATTKLDHRADWERWFCYSFAALIFWNGCYFAMKAVEAST